MPASAARPAIDDVEALIEVNDELRRKVRFAVFVLRQIHAGKPMDILRAIGTLENTRAMAKFAVLMAKRSG